MISAILAGDTELYYGLIRPYELIVYRMAVSLMKNKSDAEDVAQETFLKAFRCLVFELPIGFSGRLHNRLAEEINAASHSSHMD